MNGASSFFSPRSRQVAVRQAASILIASGLALSSECANAGSTSFSITVHATGPYEVWGGDELFLGGEDYYDTPNLGYTLLGQSNTTASFVGER